MLIDNPTFSRSGARLLLTLLLVMSVASRAMAQDFSAYLSARQAPLSLAQRRMDASVRLAAQMATQSRTPTLTARTLRLNPDGTIDVYIYLEGLTHTELQTLQRLGVQIHQAHEPYGMVYATVAAEALETIAALPFVRWISSPLPGTLRSGRVTSSGDAILGAAEARNTFEVDGSGVRVGIVSDSLVNLQASVASGDLPPDVEIVNGANGSNLANPTDEGRAVAEIIYDLAPGVALLFHSGFDTSSNMVRAIEALVAAGADVIIDDIGFFNEPVFEDGMVAQAVQNAIASGVVYVTAAGNDADRHYRGVFVDSSPGNAAVNSHNFGGGDTTLNLEIRPRGTMLAVLQWPNRFDGSANTADYDLLVFDASGNALFAPDDPNGLCTQDFQNVSGICAGMDDQTQAPPLEIVQVSNNSTTTAVTLALVVNQVSGDDLLLDIHFNREARLLEHMVADHSVFGHPCVAGALTVGAMDANDPGFDTIELFSSHGPCEIVFPTPETRAKPDLVAADGVLTTLPGFHPFFGTSAAAPHVAAIAALLVEASGGPGELSNAEIADALRQTAVDLGLDLGLPGPDPIYGAGAVDAVAAVQAVFVAPPARPAGGTGGGGGCSILPPELSPTLSLPEALGHIVLLLPVIVLMRFWRRHG